MHKKSFLNIKKYIFKLTIASLCLIFGFVSLSIAKDLDEKQKDKLLFLTKQNKNLLQENIEFNQISNNLEIIFTAIEPSQFDSLLYEKICKDISQNISDLEKTPFSDITTQNVGFPFIQNLHSLSNLIYKPYLTIQELLEYINLSEIDNANYKQTIKSYIKKFKPQEDKRSVTNLFVLKDGIESNTFNSQDQLLEMATKAKKEVNAKSLTEEYGIIVRNVVTELKSLQNDINKFAMINKDLINKNKLEISKISTPDDILELTFNNKMYFAVWGMIIAVLIMFLSLMISNKGETVKDILGKRTLIEVVSISFILLTMIILGTGEKIEGETLGALLGTIAGYVFGKSNIL